MLYPIWFSLMQILKRSIFYTCYKYAIKNINGQHMSWRLKKQIEKLLCIKKVCIVYVHAHVGSENNNMGWVNGRAVLEIYGILL